MTDDSGMAVTGTVLVHPPTEACKEKSSDEVLTAQDHEIDELSSLVLQPCKLPPREALEPVEVFVSKAIQEHQEDPESSSAVILSEKYKALIEGFRNRRNLALLTNIFISIRTTGSSLTWLSSDVDKHARLIRLLIRFDPFRTVQEDEKVNFDLVDAQFHFFMALGTANSVYCSQILSALWELLMATRSSEDDVEDGTGSDTSLNRSKRIQRCHAGIATLLDLCPSSRTKLFGTIQDQKLFLFKISAARLKFFATQTLSVLRYLPRCKVHVLSFLIQKALRLDVQIKIDDNGEVMLDTEEQDDRGKDDEKKDEKGVDAMADKLDSLMLVLFDSLKQLDSSEAYQLLAPIFDEHIVNTKKSKFVQFLLLPATKESHRDFIGFLIELLLNVERANVTRHAAACYVASYVSRCKHVTAETAAETVDALLHWAEEYIKVITKIEDESHSLFYTVCQAAFYIMAFRGASLLSFEKYNLGRDRWQYICNHSLQPLNYCLESVKAEFLTLTQAHNLVDMNVRKRMTPARKKWKKASAINSPAKIERARGGVGGLGKGENPLDSFFPFDPYLLRRSHPYIEDCYCHWNGGEDELEDEIDVDVPRSVDVEAMEDDDDDDSDMDNDDVDEERAANRKRLLSFASNATSVSSAPFDGICGQEVRQSLVKRTRALSIENGSW